VGDVPIDLVFDEPPFAKNGTKVAEHWKSIRSGTSVATGLTNSLLWATSGSRLPKAARSFKRPPPSRLEQKRQATIAWLVLAGLLLFGASAYAGERPEAPATKPFLGLAPSQRVTVRKNDWTRRVEVEQAGKRVATCRKSECSDIIYCEAR